MKNWQTPKPGGPVHPDSVQNQEKRQKQAAWEKKLSDPMYYLKWFGGWALAIGVIAYFSASGPTPGEKAATAAARAELERAKAEREYRLEWERRQAQQREAASAAKRDRELRLVDQCQSGIRAAAKVPRSVDFHFGYDFQDFPGDHAMVAQTFDAINGFGQKTTNEGRCVFGAQGELLEFWWNGVRQL